EPAGPARKARAGAGEGPGARAAEPAGSPLAGHGAGAADAHPRAPGGALAAAAPRRAGDMRGPAAAAIRARGVPVGRSADVFDREHARIAAATGPLRAAARRGGDAGPA